MHRYIFTIRDLLWLMVVVGLSCGWGVEYFCSDRRWLEFKAQSLEGMFRDNGYSVEYEWPLSIKVSKGDGWQQTRWVDDESLQNSKWRDEFYRDRSN
jgi:hypothetical protein